MSKKSLSTRNLKRIRLSARYAEKRQDLKNQIRSVTVVKERVQLSMKLAKIPRNSSKTRVINMCVLSGRTKSVLRKFKLSRIKFRELALCGMLPGVTKASW